MMLAKQRSLPKYWPVIALGILLSFGLGLWYCFDPEGKEVELTARYYTNYYICEDEAYAKFKENFPNAGTAYTLENEERFINWASEIRAKTALTKALRNEINERTLRLNALQKETTNAAKAFEDFNTSLSGEDNWFTAVVPKDLIATIKKMDPANKKKLEELAKKKAESERELVLHKEALSYFKEDVASEANTLANMITDYDIELSKFYKQVSERDEFLKRQCQLKRNNSRIKRINPLNSKEFTF